MFINDKGGEHTPPKEFSQSIGKSVKALQRLNREKMIKTHQVKIEPNAHMTKIIEDLFSYRRYCWNHSLGIWNNMYDESSILDDKSLRPRGSTVRNEMVYNKQDWQYSRSARVLQQTVVDLEKAWKNFWNPNMPNHKKPKFKSRKNYCPTFSTDRAKIVAGKLVLDKPQGISKSAWYGIRIREPVRFEGKLKLCTIVQKADGLYASLIIDTSQEQTKPTTDETVGIDVNVKRFNYNDGQKVIIYPDKLEKYYHRISYYQKVLARKRKDNPYNFRTKRYAKVKTKLRREYQKVSNMQKDILNKFTHNIVTKYSEIHIEDLNVRGMMMSKKMGKNLHRSIFRGLRDNLSYKCEWYGRKLVLVDGMYPSTQICSECGYRKTADSYGGKQTLFGDSIHHNHQEYYCYNCGAILDRDENAVENIKNYTE